MPARRHRRLLILWAAIAVILWNGVYDMRLDHGVRWYVMRASLHEARLGPAVDVHRTLHEAVMDALWTATGWTAFVLGGAAGTIWVMRDRSQS